MQQVWQQFLVIMREEVGSRAVDTWFKAIQFIGFDAQSREVLLEAPNQFVCDWVRTHHSENLRTHLGRLLHVDIATVLLRDARKAGEMVIGAPGTVNTLATIDTSAVAIIPARMIRTASQQSRALSQKPSAMARVCGLNAGYRFETFVVGSNNSFAHAAARAVTDHPGQMYNPLFIYGGSGLGKTHLLHAIGNEIKARNSGLKVLYETTDQFVNDFINAIRYDKIDQFQKKHQALDILLLDDVQFIGKKEQTQEAFFHIFNMLYDARKQIVFTSDAFPQELVGVAERLRSRFAWGLVADIHMPHLETRIAILRKKAASHSPAVSDDVIEFIADQQLSNIRELEGALVRVVAASSLMGNPVTLELARTVLRQTGPQNLSVEIDLDQVARAVCKHFSYTIDLLRSRGRSKELSHARQIAVFLMKRLTGRSLRDIAAFLGGRDHSTLIHALDRINVQRVREPEFAVQLSTLERDIIRSST